MLFYCLLQAIKLIFPVFNFAFATAVKGFMKKIYLILAVISLISLSCSSDTDTRIRLKNIAAGSVIFNFRGEAITVASGKTTDLTDIPKGTFAYTTTYSVPAGATASSASGDVSGEISIKAGTKVMLLYSSTFFEGTYTLYAALSSSDSLVTTD